MSSINFEAASYELEKHIFRHHREDLNRLSKAVGDFFPLLVELMVAKYLLYFALNDQDVEKTKTYAGDWIAAKMKILKDKENVHLKEVNDDHDEPTD